MYCHLCPVVVSEDQIHEVCGQALHAINHNNPDVFKRHATLALPLVFLAMHRKREGEGDDTAAPGEKQSAWEEVWIDATPGELNLIYSLMLIFRLLELPDFHNSLYHMR